MSRVSLSAIDDEVAAERGRLLAAQAIANNPDQKKRVEDTYGVAYCQRRWPEAYRGRVGRFFDRMSIFLTR